MCECCEMKKNENGLWEGQPLPKDNPHIDCKDTTLQIAYDVYIEHFFLWILTKGMFQSKSQIYQLNNCPNCGANLFEVWDATRKEREESLCSQK